SAAPPRPPSNTVSPYSSSSSPPHRPPPSFPTRRSSDLFWDRLCTSSVWHGVTTALMGNCGLTLAPLRPEHREPMLATFCCVEDLPVRSLSAVLPWTWQTFDEYLKAIDIGLGMNLMPLVGHNPLRLSAMDKAAWDR